MKAELAFSPVEQILFPLLDEAQQTNPFDVGDQDTLARVAVALADTPEQTTRYLMAMRAGFMPSERIMRYAGMPGTQTLVSAYVQPIADSLNGAINGKPCIFRAAEMASEIMCKGGTVGYDFSAIRPTGSSYGEYGAASAGPVAFIKMLASVAAMLRREKSSHATQVAVLRCDHPDILEFISCKSALDLATLGLNAKQSQTLDKLSKSSPELAQSLQNSLSKLAAMSITVAVTDDMMHAVRQGAEIDLVHPVPPATGPLVKKLVEGKLVYVYRSVPAKQIWEQLLASIKAVSEPGVVYIDTVNRLNNLRYIEEINACSHANQHMLQDNGSCVEGGWNLGAFVHQPFTEHAVFDFKRLETMTATSIQMLDRVLEKTAWPLPDHRTEAHSKRKIALGFFGLADVFAMMGIKYGSGKSLQLAKRIAQVMCHSAYRASIQLAKNNGPFPLFDAEEFLAPGTFASSLPLDIQCQIRKYGIRNAQLLSVVNTDSMAMRYQSVPSSGCDPIVALTSTPCAASEEDDDAQATVNNAAYSLAKSKGHDVDPVSWGVASTLTAQEQLALLSAVAPYVDGSVSMAINLPVGTTTSDLAHLYDAAYQSGLKGITVKLQNAA